MQVPYLPKNYDRLSERDKNFWNTYIPFLASLWQDWKNKDMSGKDYDDFVRRLHVRLAKDRKKMED